MEFKIKTNIVLKKEFIIETEHLEDAMEIARRKVVEEVDLNSLEIAYIGFDLTDPSIRKFNGVMCKEIIEEYKKNGKNH